MSATREDLSRICAACGLCCNGTIFGYVDLHDAEVAAFEKHRLPLVEPIEPGNASFKLPCPRFEEGAGCTIYEARPSACRRFVCPLLARAASGAATVPGSVDQVSRTRAITRRFEARGVELRMLVLSLMQPDVLGAEFDTGEAEVTRDLAELSDALRDDFGVAIPTA
jgi:hypothetical protein